MIGGMDVDSDMGLPGGDTFEDVTEMLVQAAKDMSPEEVLLTSDLTLMDSMSAFEIGEPRMDSGMLLEGEEDRPAFDALTPLLPEELCWILDRSFACEMGWHAGNTLSQTVYTLLYVHSLQDINPDLLPPHYYYANDPLRPIQLITLVLRPAVFALLKSCDFVWRELSGKRVYDVEDWHSEKCEVSLLEGVPVDMVLRKLDDAYTWLHNTDIPQEWIDTIGDRLALRKTLLQLFRASHLGDLDDLRPLTTIARKILRKVRSHPSETPGADSPALAAFDPRVTRRLPTVMPTCELELPTQSLVWDEIDRLLYGWDNVDHLRVNHSLSSWKLNGSLNLYLPDKTLAFSYIRSFTQRIFYDNRIVLEEYPEYWLLEQFFWETLGVSYETIGEVLVNNWVGPGELILREINSHLIETIAGYIRSFWFNPPRRRRHLMKSIVRWQLLEEAFVNLTSRLNPANPHAASLLKTLPATAASWKLTTAREIVLSGFQQELYASYERPLAYWCLAKVIEQHLENLETLKESVPAESDAFYELEYHSQLLAILQTMSMALFVVCLLCSSLNNKTRFYLNFCRRYKWLCTGAEDDPDALLFPFPSLSDFHTDLENGRQVRLWACT
ncbi:hypothetical protein PHLGIDRAFT_105599 [Phlebiopsis gigantea 11061_1 CR5-6]|uniref:Mak10-domain-containing protein n=1 Tax=Phlebiopsis gigantea (strain 11061_1 CR5-6) TaxID=745531 RepID=A0A0C3NQP6_PHLG1|nr:hypothetical protein PHLGIDRAFT_105599 [Phlebiopsis gigantea 11061_1 CR5-6]